jgi:hypothetical protein
MPANASPSDSTRKPLPPKSGRRSLRGARFPYPIARRRRHSLRYAAGRGASPRQTPVRQRRINERATAISAVCQPSIRPCKTAAMLFAGSVRIPVSPPSQSFHSPSLATPDPRFSATSILPLSSFPRNEPRSFPRRCHIRAQAKARRVPLRGRSSKAARRSQGRAKRARRSEPLTARTASRRSRRGRRARQILGRNPVRSPEKIAVRYSFAPRSRHSCLNATMGSTFIARRAGK